MRTERTLGGFLVVSAAQGVIGWVAVEAIQASVTPSPSRDLVLLAIWPMVIIAGAVVAITWIWRQPVAATRQAPPATHPSRRSAPSNTQPPEPASPQLPPPLTTRDYVPSDLTVEYLTSHFKGRTGIQGAKLVEVYLGKWMRLSGPLGNVGAGPTLYQVTFAGSSNQTYMYFRDEKAVERLSMLSPGTQIVAEGRITKIQSMWVDFEDCELISP